MPNSWHIKQAVRVLRAGGIIAYPTEAVFGLGCNPYDPGALERLLDLKERATTKGFIIIGSSINQITPFIEPLDKAMKKKIMATWPGPVTWLLPARPDVSPLLCGAHTSIAVRVTAHPIAAALCDVMDHAIVSTSANIAGSQPAHNALDVRRKFGDAIDFILPGSTGGSDLPTEIRDAETDTLIRP